jgi:hypothetical protein
MLRRDIIFFSFISRLEENYTEILRNIFPEREAKLQDPDQIQCLKPRPGSDLQV